MNMSVSYKKKEHLEHIYDIPDTYIGSIDVTEQNVWVFSEDKTAMEHKCIKYVPGFFKIFDEILVNAIDHRQRDPNVKNIKVTFSEGLSEIKVWNDGEGIDVDIHPEYNQYIPEMLFGELLTSSNYESDQKRVTGGKNGYGSKLTNIFSKRFCIETIDSKRQKKYSQEFRNNMYEKDKPHITKCTTKPYTCITFLPDYEKFQLPSGITRDIFLLFERRVYDAVAVTPDDMNIFFNGEKIKIKNFEKYIDYYLPKGTLKCMSESQERWKVCIALSPNREFMEVSFVNGIWTSRGGKHMESVVNQIVDRLKEQLSKNAKTKTKTFKPSHIKENMWVFVNCLIENPSFTSQTKEEMTTKISEFGSKWVVCEKMIDKFFKGGFLERILETSSEMDEKSMKKSDGVKKTTLRIPKLEDANFAGTKRSRECTLILTEGDSAKTSALSGLSVHGPSFRDTFGVFPLKGKFINVRDAPISQVLNNEEVKNLKQIIGLQQGKEYTLHNIHELRYGSISLMTDQDSVTGDTPILLRNKNNGHIYVEVIEQISKHWMKNQYDKEIARSTHLEVYTDTGFTNIVKIIRHKVSKNVYRVITDTGIVDVTEDHSLLDEFKNVIKPNDCMNQRLLYSTFPCLSNKRKLYQNVFCSSSKLKCQEAYLRFACDGNHLSVQYDENSELYIIKTHPEKLESPNVVKQIICLGKTEQYVYDLETENHHFQAGVGNLIVHNTDGSHIKGLVINFFHHFFPSLLKIDGFLKTYVTPIVRGFKGNSSVNFYTIHDYEEFKRQNTGYEYKYYKGLGTSSSKEIQEYFKQMDEITIKYEYDVQADDSIDMAFKKCKTNERKQWLKTYDPSHTLEYNMNEKGKNVCIDDFIHKDLKHFSNSDNIRSIPNIIDGFKPSQRKVLYGTLLKCGSQTKEIKVAQLSGFISEKTCYHHGEMSLEQTIIGMSQQFVGKNNVNWFEPIGMFGTRLSGGKDHASSRYIFTNVCEITHKTFRKEDNCLLEYLDDDGIMIEPRVYYPILPVILMNGTEGIGTGYSTSIPCFNPIQIADECIAFAKGLIVCDNWIPWYFGFKGVVTETADSENNYTTHGVYEWKDSRLIVTELPIGVWTESYKEFLDEQIGVYLESKKKTEKKELQKKTLPIINYINRSTDESVYFEIQFDGLEMTDVNESFLTRMKLTTKLSTANMYLYVNNELYKFSNVKQIIEHFCKERLELYAKRKDIILAEYHMQLMYLREKIRFLEYVMTDKIIVFKKKKETLAQELTEHGFQKKDNGYDYLVKMPIDQFTDDKMNELIRNMQMQEETTRELEQKTPNDIWISDILEWKQTYLNFISNKKTNPIEEKPEKKKTRVKKSKQ